MFKIFKFSVAKIINKVTKNVFLGRIPRHFVYENLG